MRDHLLRTIREAGQEIDEAQFPDGSRLLLVPHGGRVLGLFGPREEENFFWTNPDLDDVGSARRLFESAGWHNPGGDRTWLAPEVDFFLPDYPKLDEYAQPRDLDAGTYSVERKSGAYTLRNEVRASLSRSKIDLTVEIRKEIGPAPDPLRCERHPAAPDDLEYAGYTLRTSVRVLEHRGTGEAWVGGWSLLQLPHGGTLVVPTYGPAAPLLCFGKLNPKDLVLGERMLLWRMAAPGEHKMAIRAIATTGRAGYLHQTRNAWSLIVRNFGVNPSGEYVDVPWGAPEDLGYALQACNVKSALGAFSELEHHAPAVKVGDGRACEDVSQVWAYRGGIESVRSVAERLLGPLPGAIGSSWSW
jgi:hypothetical protein